MATASEQETAWTNLRGTLISVISRMSANYIFVVFGYFALRGNWSAFAIHAISAVLVYFTLALILHADFSRKWFTRWAWKRYLKQQKRKHQRETDVNY